MQSARNRAIYFNVAAETGEPAVQVTYVILHSFFFGVQDRTRVAVTYTVTLNICFNGEKLKRKLRNFRSRILIFRKSWAIMVKESLFNSVFNRCSLKLIQYSMIGRLI